MNYLLRCLFCMASGFASDKTTWHKKRMSTEGFSWFKTCNIMAIIIRKFCNASASALYPDGIFLFCFTQNYVTLRVFITINGKLSYILSQATFVFVITLYFPRCSRCKNFNSIAIPNLKKETKLLKSVVRCQSHPWLLTEA